MMENREHFFIQGREHQAEPLHYRECGLDNIYLLNGFNRETIDGEEYVTILNMDGLWKAIGLNLVVHQKTFNPKEIRFLRHQMDLTQAELAKLLRVTDQTVARWEKGETEIPGPADVALRVAFLTSDRAQPEGQKILEQFAKFVRSLADIDETGPAPNAMFDHRKKAGSWSLDRSGVFASNKREVIMEWSDDLRWADICRAMRVTGGMQNFSKGECLRVNGLIKAQIERGLARQTARGRYQFKLNAAETEPTEPTESAAA